MDNKNVSVLGCTFLTNAKQLAANRPGLVGLDQRYEGAGGGGK